MTDDFDAALRTLLAEEAAAEDRAFAAEMRALEACWPDEPLRCAGCGDPFPFPAKYFEGRFVCPTCFGE